MSERNLACEFVSPLTRATYTAPDPSDAQPWNTEDADPTSPRAQECAHTLRLVEAVEAVFAALVFDHEGASHYDCLGNYTAHKCPTCAGIARISQALADARAWPALASADFPSERTPGALYPEGYDLALALRSVGPGWRSLVEELFEQRPEDVAIVLVTSDRGALAAYAEPEGDFWFSRVLARASDASLRTCEVCAADAMPQQIGDDIATLCVQHARQRREPAAKR